MPHGRGLPSGERPSASAEPGVAAARTGASCAAARSTRAGWPGRVREGRGALLCPRAARNRDAVGGGQRSAAPGRPHALPKATLKCALAYSSLRVGAGPTCRSSRPGRALPQSREGGKLTGLFPATPPSRPPPRPAALRRRSTGCAGGGPRIGVEDDVGRICRT
jgi:hypothetical protein